MAIQKCKFCDKGVHLWLEDPWRKCAHCDGTGLVDRPARVPVFLEVASVLGLALGSINDPSVKAVVSDLLAKINKINALDT